MITIRIEVDRRGAGPATVLEVEAGTPVRTILRKAGLSPEGCAVFLDGASVPRDLPIERSTVLTVVPTFSGG